VWYGDVGRDTQLLSRLKPAKNQSLGNQNTYAACFFGLSHGRTNTTVTKINGAVVLARRRVIRVWLFPAVRFLVSKLLIRA
jgi:hypothetical protein